MPVDFHVLFWKSELIDFVILQQDAFDEIDRMTPLERQKYMLYKVLSIVRTSFSFDKFEEVGLYFRGLINYLKQMNYAEFKSEDFHRYEEQLDESVKERAVQEESVQTA